MISPQWILDLTEADGKTGKCVDKDGDLVLGDGAVYGIVKDCGIFYWPRYCAVYSGECPAFVVGAEPGANITVNVGDFLINVNGSLRVATVEESLTMAVVARAREQYTGPPTLVLVSVWL
jgi:hypothetical protein